MNRFANRAAMITGGGSGIGEATAKRLFAEGASVVLVDANGDGAQRVAESLGDAKRVHSLALDITDRARIHMMMAEAAARFGQVAGNSPGYWGHPRRVLCAGCGGVVGPRPRGQTLRELLSLPRNLRAWR